MFDNVITVNAPVEDNESHRAVYYIDNDHQVVKKIFGKCYPWLMQERLAIEVLKVLHRRGEKPGDWMMCWQYPDIKSAYDHQTKMFRTHKPTCLRVVREIDAASCWDRTEIDSDRDELGNQFNEMTVIFEQAKGGVTGLADRAMENYEEFLRFKKEPDEIIAKVWRDTTGERSIDVPTVH